MKNNQSNITKCIVVVISIIIVAFTLTGYMIISDESGIPLNHFESFYIYVFTIIFSVYLSYKNHKYANIAIGISILTYGWTYLLVQKTINYFNDPTITTDTYFYIYLASAIPLIISLFISNKSKSTTEQSPIHNYSSNITNNIDKDHLQFASFILGPKNIPYDTDVLLINNNPDNTLDFIYIIEKKNNIFRISKDNIVNINYKESIKVQNNKQKVVSHETKSMLLSAATFGGSPLMQLAGNSLFESIIDDASNNYDKVELNTYYEISIEFLEENQKNKFLLKTNNNPDVFINKFNSK